MVKELEAITEIYHQNQDAWNNLRTTPPTISKKQYYLSRTESMRIPLSSKDLIDLKGFINVKLGGEQNPE